VSLNLVNPANGARKSTIPFLWCLIFGGFYFIIHGIWTQAVISLFVSLITFGIGWFVYPFFAKRIVRNHYLKLGWVEQFDYYRRIADGTAPVTWVGANKEQPAPKSQPEVIKVRCSKCGVLNSEQAKFCSNCGKPF
jgi:hypothetical protein